MARWVNRPEGSNWGDFGMDDQKGRMNLITPQRRLAGVREVVDGVAFCLSLPLDYPRGRGLTDFRRPPQLIAHRMADGEAVYNQAGKPGGFHCVCDLVCDDSVTIALQYSSQWDGLCHWGRRFDADGDGQAEMVYYNGWRGGEHILGPDEGGPYAKALGIDNLAEAAPQSRAAVVDLHRIYGDEPVSVGYDDLMRAFDAQKVTVEPGDFLIIHTGLDAIILGMGEMADTQKILTSCPTLNGHDEALLRWITDSGVVALCSDATAVETVNRTGTPSDPEATRLPLHTHCLFKLGVHLGELWYLKELADYLWEHKRSACLLTAPPLRLPGAVGSPANAIALV